MEKETNTTNDTPETDIEERMAYLQEYIVPTDFARKLERERDDARMTIEDVKKALRADQYEGPILAALRVVEERDEAIKEMNRYKRQWEESRSENVENAK